MTLPAPSVKYDISESDGHWLAGISDGEACFSFGTRNRRLTRYTGKIFRSINFLFKINLRADDLATLNTVQKILGGIGSIHHDNRKRASWKGVLCDGHPQYVFRVGSKDQIARVVDVFRRFPLRSKKRRDFELWAKAYDLYSSTIVNTPRTCFSKGVLQRPSSKERRPPIGTPRKRLYSLPDDVYAQLVAYEDEIRETRKFA